MTMKKILSATVAFAMILIAVSCGGKDKTGAGGTNGTERPVSDVTVTESAPVTDTPDAEDSSSDTTAPSGDTPAVDTVPFETYVGWWTRPQSYYSEERSYFDTFRVNADGTYTKINKYGAEVYTKPCKAEGTTLVFEVDGTVLTYYFDGTRLNSADGKVEFVAGSEVTPFDISSVYGKWYRFGDTSDDCYTIIEGKSYHTHGDNKREIAWRFTEGTITHGDGSVEDDMVFVCDAINGNGESNSYSLIEGGKVLYDSKYGDAYIHESVIATEEGRALAKLFTLVCYTWEGENYDLDFDYYDSTFTLTEYTENDEGVEEKIAVAGRWSLDGAELMFEFNDPELSDEITPFDGETFFVATYKDTFERSRF